MMEEQMCTAGLGIRQSRAVWHGVGQGRGRERWGRAYGVIERDG